MRSAGRDATARASRWTAVLAVALAIVAALGLGDDAAAAQEAVDPGVGEVRVAARPLADGRVEVALQTRAPDGGWSGRVAPPRRFLPADAEPGRWLWTGAVALEGAEWRVTARRLADGRAEVALQARIPGGAWSGRLLPERRFLPANSEAGRWLGSSPVTTALEQPQIVSFYGHPDVPAMGVLGHGTPAEVAARVAAWAERYDRLNGAACSAAGVRAKRTRPYRPQTNGKVERFHRTLIEEWAYVRVYRSESERAAALGPWLHRYNHHRCHTALGGEPPISRVNNVTGHYN